MWNVSGLSHRWILVVLITIPLFCVFSAGWPWPCKAGESISLQSVMQTGQLMLSAGQSTVMFVADVIRVAVAEPSIADVAVIGKSEVLVSARKVGTTSLHIWDQNGLTSVDIRVVENTAELEEQLRLRIGMPGVEPWVWQGTVVLEGSVNSVAEKERARRIAGAFGDVIDLLTINAAQIESTVTEETADTVHTDEQLLAEMRALINDDNLHLQVVNGTLLITGNAATPQSQERARKIAALYFSQVVDASLVRLAETGTWPVEVIRVVDKSVVEVEK
ncbi:MAG TPA: BON domain-containing protein [Firmicutes bacterium]|jgi:Flp pilus assembly secretin CpaC|nr:BON domain-containing protein [Bacillota bacterium]